MYFCHLQRKFEVHKAPALMTIGLRNMTPCSSAGCDQRLAAASCLWRQQTLATSINLHDATSIAVSRKTLRLCLSQCRLLRSISYICYYLLSFIYSFLSVLNSLLSSLFFSILLLFLFYLSVYIFVPPSFIITPSASPHTCCLLRLISVSRVCRFLALIQLQGM